MTIKEIAQLAGVSVATVSKVLNRKDSHISTETRERILKIAKECHYTPYGDVLNKQKTRKFLIGIMIDSQSGNDRVVSELARALGRKGYSAILASSKTSEDEYKNYMMLLSYQVDGIIWNPVKNYDERQETLLKESGVPYVVLDFRKESTIFNISFDYKEMGYKMTQMLIEREHCEIMCLLEIHGARAELFFQGYLQCLFDNGIVFRDSLIQKWNKDEPFIFNLSECTGVVCFDLNLARRISAMAKEQGLSVPEDLSIVAAGKGEVGETEEDITTLGYPIRQLSQFTIDRLVNKIEGIEEAPVRFQMRHEFNHLNSLHTKSYPQTKRIIVIGPVCMLTELEMSENMGCEGNAVAKTNRLKVDGSISQSYELEQVGLNSYLIGKIGRDHFGVYLYRYLKENNFHMDGIQIESDSQTAHLYQLSYGDKKQHLIASGSDVLYLDGEELKMYRHLFYRARFCLLYEQMGIDKLKEAIGLAREMGVSPILRCDFGNLGQVDVDLDVDMVLIYQENVQDFIAKADLYLEKGAKAVAVLSSDEWYGKDCAGNEIHENLGVTQRKKMDAITAQMLSNMTENHSFLGSLKIAVETCNK
ncbi:MAG: LacI family DNA-binding transcriptional regulator [Tyzzerella sp.]|nr:LacI family DNA-binding transcriptional regulator [Tyzzerella sp.]